MSISLLFSIWAITIRTAFEYETTDTNLLGYGNYLILLYILQLIVIFSLSLSVKLKNVESEFKIMASIYGIEFLFILGLQCKYILEPETMYPNYKDEVFLGMMLGILVCVFLHCAFFDLLKGIVHMIFFSMSFINLFITNAIANINDCHIVQMNDKLTQEDSDTLEEFGLYRTRMAVIWVLINALNAYLLNLIDKEGRTTDYWSIYAVGYFGCLCFAVKIAGSILYMGHELLLEFWYKRALQNDKNYKPSPVKKVRYSKKLAEQAREKMEEYDFEEEYVKTSPNKNKSNHHDKAADTSKIKDNIFNSKFLESIESYLEESRKYGDINGDYIRSIRRRKTLSINDVSKMTKIDKFRLQILENNIDRPTPEEAAIIKYYINNAK